MINLFDIVFENYNFSTSLKFPLIPTKEWKLKNSENLSWAYEVIPDMIKKNFPKKAKTWDMSFDQDAMMSISGMVRRLLEEVTENGNVKLRDTKKSAVLEFLYLEPKNIIQRGDLRYGSGELANIIKSGKDLAPIECGKVGNSIHVLNGHHRIRAYIITNEKIPAFVGSVVEDSVPQIYFSANLDR